MEVLSPLAVSLSTRDATLSAGACRNNCIPFKSGEPLALI